MPCLRLKSWVQMYKVFIDHKPILFVNESEMSPNLISVRFEKLNDFSVDIADFMTKVTIDNPIQVICSNPRSSFDFVFRDYKLIEAAGGVVRCDNKLLMIYRNGLWDIPKGKIEVGEDYETAAIREVEEECGIVAPIIEEYLCETYHTYSEKGKQILKKTTWFVMNHSGTEKLTPELDEGITDVEWFSKKKFLNTRGNTYGSINEVIDQYNSAYLEKLGD